MQALYAIYSIIELLTNVFVMLIIVQFVIGLLLAFNVVSRGNDFVISVYRTFVASKGISVPASKIAKWKTLFQQLAVAFALWPWFAVDHEWTWQLLLWIAVLLSVVSGIQYLWYSRVTEKALAESTA